MNKPSQTTRSEQKIETQSLILKTAKKAFLQKGYTETTIRDIAEQAGIATGTVFIHFPSRPSLLAAKATYLFRAGRASRRLLIDAKGVRTYRGSNAHADFEIIFLDLPGALRRMAREPNNLFELVVTNQM